VSNHLDPSYGGYTVFEIWSKIVEAEIEPHMDHRAVISLNAVQYHVTRYNIMVEQEGRFCSIFGAVMCVVRHAPLVFHHCFAVCSDGKNTWQSRKALNHLYATYDDYFLRSKGPNAQRRKGGHPGTHVSGSVPPYCPKWEIFLKPIPAILIFAHYYFGAPGAPPPPRGVPLP